MRRGDLVVVVASRDFGKPRPALVIQSDWAEATESVVVLLLSSTLMPAANFRYTLEPNADNGLRVTSQVQVDKMQSVPRQRVGTTIGHLDDEAMANITRLLALFLGIA